LRLVVGEQLIGRPRSTTLATLTVPGAQNLDQAGSGDPARRARIESLL
jgi:hypothetical protein